MIESGKEPIGSRVASEQKIEQAAGRALIEAHAW
jgi:hypothetical protein